MKRPMQDKAKLEDLVRSLISVREKAELGGGCLTVLPWDERSILKAQIESCVQALFWLTLSLDSDAQKENSTASRPGLR